MERQDVTILCGPTHQIADRNMVAWLMTVWHACKSAGRTPPPQAETLYALMTTG